MKFCVQIVRNTEILHENFFKISFIVRDHSVEC